MSQPSSPASARAVSALGASVRHDVAPVHATPSDQPVFIGVVIIVVVAALKVVLRKKLAPRHQVSLDLVLVTVGFTLVLMMRLPLAGTSGLVGLGLFAGLAGLYKLLGYFEEPKD